MFATNAVFEDGPEHRPQLWVADGQWPPTVPWVCKNDTGEAVLYIYTHRGGGHYRVAASALAEYP